MDTGIILAGAFGAVVSALAIYVFYELTVAYWAPDKAHERYKTFIDLPKLRFFAPSFRWLMPLFIVVMVLQLFVSVQMIVSTIAGS